MDSNQGNITDPKADLCYKEAEDKTHGVLMLLLSVLFVCVCVRARTRVRACVRACVCVCEIFVVDRFYLALFSALEQTYLRSCQR